MTIMDVAGPIIEEQRNRADAAIVLGIRNMAKLCHRFNQSEGDTRSAITEEYPDTDTELIDSIISEIYEGK